MRIAIVSVWFSENTGYAENMLPKALAARGHEVHLITSCAQVFYNSPDYSSIFAEFLGSPVVDPCVKTIDGYTLHRLPHTTDDGVLRIPNLKEYLVSLNADILQTFEILEQVSYEAAMAAESSGALLFTECHIHKSVFPDGKTDGLSSVYRKYFKKDWTLDYINDKTVYCYPIGEDVADLAINYFRVPAARVKIQSLGVDTGIFRPYSENEIQVREAERKALGYETSDIVCIYTGRFAQDKDPHTLAKAIEILHNQGHTNFKALFNGNGTRADEEFLLSKPGCTIQPFVPVHQLYKRYWSADIAVWPRQESTSQLDAIACGLPLILSDKIHVTERINGNGLLYKEGDAADLAAKLLSLEDKNIRTQLGKAGSEKAEAVFSWNAIAADREKDYIAALKGIKPQKSLVEKAGSYIRNKIL